MARKYVLLLALAAAVLAGPAAGAQEVSKKKELAVFDLSYYQWTIPSSALARIDEQVRDVFVNLGRFDVIGMTYRLGEEDVRGFIDSIRTFKEQNAEIPEQVQMGREFFTQADMQRLVSSFIVVIPSVTRFQSEWDRDGSFTTEIRTSFSFVNVETLQTFAQFAVSTRGSDRNPAKSVQDAIDAIPLQLTFQVRKVGEFQLRTGILEVRGGEVLIEFGRDMGVKPGDEYLVLGTRVLKSGKQVSDEKGLLIVRQVKDEVSTAAVVYANSRLQEGEQLQELPRLGIDVTPLLRVVALQVIPSQFSLPTLVGIRAGLARGFFGFRPQLTLELPLHVLADTGYAAAYGGIPLNVSLGGEYNLYLGRLQLVPMAAVGVGLALPLESDQTPQLMHFGGSAGLAVTYLFSRDVKAVVEAGYLGWMGNGGFSYDGLYGGAGISVKF